MAHRLEAAFLKERRHQLRFPAITELAQLDSSGKEQLWVSRLW
jgi:hypothetical protein